MTTYFRNKYFKIEIYRETDTLSRAFIRYYRGHCGAKSYSPRWDNSLKIKRAPLQFNLLFHRKPGGAEAAFGLHGFHHHPAGIAGG